MLTLNEIFEHLEYFIDNKYYDNYYIIFLPAILGIAYPILLQSLARIDDKYQSTFMVDFFCKEPRYIKFKLFLGIAIIFNLYLPFALEPCYNCFIIKYSALFLALISLVLVIIYLIRLVRLILIYYKPEDLQKRLNNKALKSGLIFRYRDDSPFSLKNKMLSWIKNKLSYRIGLFQTIKTKWIHSAPNWIKIILSKIKGYLLNICKYDIFEHNKTKRLFKANKDLYLYAVRNSNEDLIAENYSFFSKYIAKKRSESKGNLIVYEPVFCNCIIEINEALSKAEEKLISINNVNNLITVLYDDIQQTRTSESTYSLIWICLKQQLFYNRDNWVMQYWVNADQHYRFFLKNLNFSDYDYTYSRRYTKEEVIQRDEDRIRFREFHNALGGYLMYKGKYELLNGFLFHTNQQPPEYALLTKNFAETVKLFIEVHNNDYSNPVEYQNRYPFGFYGIDSDGLIRMWIKKYLVIQFLVLYKRYSYYINDNYFDIPNIPSDLSEKSFWIEALPHFEKLNDEIIDNKDMLNQLGLPEYNKQWFIENNKPDPNTLIENLLLQLNGGYKDQKLNLVITEAKKKKFINDCIESANKFINKYSVFTKEGSISEPKEDIPISYRSLMDRMALSDEQDKGYGGLETHGVAFATRFVDIINYKLSTYDTTQSYLIVREDLFKAIDKLSVNKDKYRIICFGLYLDYYLSNDNKRLVKDKNNQYTFNGIQIIDLPQGSNYYLNSYIIICQIDLIAIKYTETTKEIIDTYKLEPEDTQHKIYVSVFDLIENKGSDVNKKVEHYYPDRTEEQSLLVNFDMAVELSLKKDAEVIKIQLFNQYNDSRMYNTIDEVKPI